jgi:hypothetical protein
MSAPRTALTWSILPGLPNELSCVIIHNLSVLDILRARHVSFLWEHVFDINGELCKKLFVLPKTLRLSNSVKRQEFIDDQWQKRYRSLRPDATQVHLWAGIEINPLLDNREGRVLDEGAHSFNPFECRFLTPPAGLTHQQRIATKQFMRSMFVTYPLVRRIRLLRRYKAHHSLGNPPKSHVCTDDCGVSIAKLVGQMGLRAMRDWSYRTLLSADRA